MTDAQLATLLTNLAQILDAVKQEWGASWSEWDQEQRDAISKWLSDYYAVTGGTLTVTE